MSSPANYTFRLYQGQTWQNTLVLKDNLGAALNLTGYTARLQVRETIESATTIFDLTSGNGLTVNGLAGSVSILVSASNMSALVLPNYEIAQWVYDLEIASADATPIVTRVLQGAVIVVPEVTR